MDTYQARENIVLDILGRIEMHFKDCEYQNWFDKILDSYKYSIERLLKNSNLKCAITQVLELLDRIERFQVYSKNLPKVPDLPETFKKLILLEIGQKSPIKA